MRRLPPTAALLPIAAAIAAGTLAACAGEPVRWTPATAAVGAAGPGAPNAVLPVLASLPEHASGVRCAASLRSVGVRSAAPDAPGAAGAAGAASHAAMGHGAAGVPSSGTAGAAGIAAGAAPDTADVVAVWWSVRPDSSAWLVSARGTAGGAAWEPAVPVDTFDRGLRGCTRPAPSLAFEPATRYVHVVYFLDAPEGPGLFYAHSMDGGRLYDPEPEPIVYGARVSRAAVAARRDTVAVAFEDPNTEPPQVTLALSVTGGHLWIDKTIRVSGTTTTAEAPEVVVDAAGLTVGWMERQGPSATPVRRRGTWVRPR